MDELTEERFRRLCERIDALEKHIIVRLDAQKEALSLAKSEMDRRLEGMNEFREQLTRQAVTFPTKVEVELKLEKLEEKMNLVLSPICKKIDDQAKADAANRGAWGVKDYIATVFISGVSALILFLMSHWLLNK